MSRSRVRPLLAGIAVVAAALGAGCSSPRNLAPHPVRMIADLTYRSRAIDDVCRPDVEDLPRVFGDVRLDSTRAIDAGDVTLSIGSLAERLSRAGGGSRVRDRDESVLEQLADLTVADVATAWAHAQARFAESVGSESLDPGWLGHTTPLGIDPGPNAVCGFLVNHVVALRFAAMATDTLASDPAWSFALAHEAAALGYLVDAMSADRMLDARGSGPFLALSRNRRDAERYFAGNGVYVIDHLGHVWQAHGRDQLEWYHPHLCRVMAASQEAVRELFLTAIVSRSRPLPPYLDRWVARDPLGREPETIVREWSADRSGPAWLTDQRLGSLAALPTPIWAAWRRKAGTPDEDGIRPAAYRPQLREEGLHDPSIGPAPVDGDDVASDAGPASRRALVGLDELHPAAAFPDWASPAEWLARGPAHAIASDRDMASTRFVHLVRYPPSMSGLYVSGSLGAGVAGGDLEAAHAISVGYLRHLALAWLGTQLELSPRFLQDGREVAAATAVVGLGGPLHRPSVWIEMGVARADAGSSIDWGFRGRVGYVPFTIGPGLRYSGLSPRLELDVTGLVPSRVRAGVTLLLH